LEAGFNQYKEQMDKFLHTMHEARVNGLDELDRKIQGQEESITNMAEVIRKQAAALKQDAKTFEKWMDWFNEIEEELKVTQVQVSSLSDWVCRCRDVDAVEWVPSPALSYAGSQQSYHTPPVASPCEDEIPLPVLLANSNMDIEAKNIAPQIKVEDGEVHDGNWTYAEAKGILRDIEAAYHQDMAVANQCHVVRSKAQIPLARIEPYTGCMALGSRESQWRAREASDEKRVKVTADGGKELRGKRPHLQIYKENSVGKLYRSCLKRKLCIYGRMT
jgi:hypothetical protein